MSERRPVPPRQARARAAQSGLGGAEEPRRRERFLDRLRSREREAARAQPRGRARAAARPRRRSRMTMGEKIMLIASTLLGILIVVSFVLPYVVGTR
ncbi:MAG: hypothetical protein HY688_04635 [Chloroflexi bacterium]|nr:hypothetical protein [Chloroflexota bacterium]